MISRATATFLILLAVLVRPIAPAVAQAPGLAGNPGNVIGPAVTTATAVPTWGNSTGTVLSNSLDTISAAGTLAISPTAHSAAPGLAITQFPSGTVVGGYLGNSVACGSYAAPENLTITNLPLADCLKVNWVLGGPTVNHGGQAVEGYATLNGATNPGNMARFYSGGAFTAEAMTGDNGAATVLTASAAAGATSLSVASTAGFLVGDPVWVQLNNRYFGYSYFSTVIAAGTGGSTLVINPALPVDASANNAVIVAKGEINGLQAGAVTDGSTTTPLYLSAAVGFEAHMRLLAGTSTPVKIWNNATSDPDDVEQGIVVDAGYGLSTSPGGGTTRTGWLVGDYSGRFPLSSDGTVIQIIGHNGGAPYAIAQGIDFSQVAINDYILNSQYAKLTNSALLLGDDGAQSVVASQGAAANADLVLQAKGAGVVGLANGGGTPVLQAQSDGNVVIPGGSLGVGGGLSLAGAAPTVGAGQIGYGATTAPASRCGGQRSGAAGCLVINIGGATHYLPYY